MGFSIVDPVEGPVVTISYSQRQLISRAAKQLGLALVVHGPDCPACLYAHVTRASVLHVMRSLITKVSSVAATLDADEVRWTSGRKTSEVLVSLAQTTIAEVEPLTSTTVEIWDNYRLCDHEAMKAVKRKRRTKPIE